MQEITKCVLIIVDILFRDLKIDFKSWIYERVIELRRYERDAG